MLGEQKGKNEAGVVRQRKGRSSDTNNDDQQQVEPLDEADQARLIEELRAENVRQQESIWQIFRYLCLVAAVVLILSVLYLDQWHMTTTTIGDDATSSFLLRALSIGHGVSSALLHSISAHLTKPYQPVGLVFRIIATVDVTMAVSVLWACRRHTQTDATLLYLHYGIGASNVFIVLAAVLLRWDAQSTDKSFQDLVHAQYRFKSL